MTYAVEVRREAFGLLAGGMVPALVGAALGVSATTVRGWRAEVGGVIREQAPLSVRYLSREERYEIARLHEGRVAMREIGRRLGRDPATISRELGRALRPPGAPGRPAGRAAGRAYQPEACHRAALAARVRPKQTKLATNMRLREWVQHRLNEKDSPEQITGRLLKAFGKDPEMNISHETIYRAIYVRPRGELRGQLQRETRAHLRTGRSTRQRRNTRQPHEISSQQHTGPGHIIGAVSIHDRPEEIEARLVPGHYEGDLVVGPGGTRAAIGTLVERTSGHLTSFHIPDRTTITTINALAAALGRTGWPMTTLTWDRGKEMAGHAQFSIDTGIAVYFADPHAPWQRGSNESANGLLRQYFPKGLDLADVTDHDLQAAVTQLNNRPRKRHQFATPNEVLADILAKDQTNPGVATTG